MIRFVELVNETSFDSRTERTAIPSFSLGEVWINETYVVSVRKASGYKKLLNEGRLPQDLDQNHDFTAVTTNNGALTETHIVVGDISVVAKRLHCDTRTLLKG